MAYAYQHNPALIYAESFATIKGEADLDAISPEAQDMAIRLIHACGMVDVLDDFRFAEGAITAGRAALASGAPLFAGLISGIIGGIIVGSLSGSPLGVSGPAAGLAVIVLNAITDLGGFDIFMVAVIIAGVLQVIMGFTKAGIIAYFFLSSVIHGMLAGIGILIFLKQIPHAFGYDKDPEGDFGFNQVDGHNTFDELINM